MSFSYHFADGNPGALMCLAKLANFNQTDPQRANIISKKIVACDIRGTDLYVLFNDLAKGDLERVYELCKECPDDTLKAACSRQDRKGREMVAIYMRPRTEEDLLLINKDYQRDIELYKKFFIGDDRELLQGEIKDLVLYGARWAYIRENLHSISSDIIGYYEMHDDVDSTDLSDMSRREAEYYMSNEEDAKNFDFTFF